MLELNIFQEFRLKIQKRNICGKEPFILSDLQYIKSLCEENGIEEYIITKTLKRRITDTIPEEISFYLN